MKIRASKFNLLFKEVMKSIKKQTIFEEVRNPYYGKSIKFILEDISRPVYLTSKTGKKVLLENALKMPTNRLIAEGFSFSAVKSIVSTIFKKIVDGLKAMMAKSLEALAAFVDRIKNNSIVKRITAKYSLEEKAEAVKKGVSTKIEGDTLTTVVNLGKMNDEFEKQVASLDVNEEDSKLVEESVGRLLLEDAISSGTGEFKNSIWRRLINMSLALLVIGSIASSVVSACGLKEQDSRID